MRIPWQCVPAYPRRACRGLVNLPGGTCCPAAQAPFGAAWRHAQYGLTAMDGRGTLHARHHKMLWFMA